MSMRAATRTQMSMLAAAKKEGNNEMSYPTRVDVCDGKYTIIYDLKTGQSECLRYGEKWRSLTGDKMVLAMFDEIVALREEVAKLKAEPAPADPCAPEV